jgi:hypothetical protein
MRLLYLDLTEHIVDLLIVWYSGSEGMRMAGEYSGLGIILLPLTAWYVLCVVFVKLWGKSSTIALAAFFPTVSSS